MVTLSVGLVDHWVLQERQETALAELTMATEQIEQLEEAPPPALDTERSILDRFESALDASRQALDIEAQISSLQTSVESSISQLIDLIVVFVVQTLLLPLLAFYIAVGSFKWFWRWSLSNDPGSNRRPRGE
jgi:predicted PurR-regulated permease PerM